jgi:hypothetical protein
VVYLETGEQEGYFVFDILANKYLIVEYEDIQGTGISYNRTNVKTSGQLSTQYPLHTTLEESFNLQLSAQLK